MEVMNCPACGAPLKLRGGEELVRCDYCGCTVRVQRRSVNQDGSVTITDGATGMKIASVRVPFGYHTVGALLPNISSYDYPIGISAGANDGKGAVISYFIGEGYCDRSKCRMLSGMYSQGIDQVSKTNYKNFQDVTQYLDAYVSMYASSNKASGVSFCEERQMPLYEAFDENAAMENFKQLIAIEKQRTGNAEMAKDLGYYLKGVCRVYDITIQQQTFKLAVVTVVKAWKYQFIGGLGAFSALGDIGSKLGDSIGNKLGSSFGDSIGSALGGMNGNLSKALFGNSIIGRAIEKNAQQAKQEAPQQPREQKSVESFGNMPNNGIIAWKSDGVFILQCPPHEFESEFCGAFTDFCSTFRLDDGIKEKMYNMQNDILRNIERHAQQRIDQMNRQFQSWQQVHATQQAAFDSYNKAWWARTNATDSARRSAYQSKMAAEGRMSDRYSEAVRGVNTYVRDDGTEVEVSVAYDRAYTNNAGDTMGSNSAFEPGGSWHEMNRKQ